MLLLDNFCTCWTPSIWYSISDHLAVHSTLHLEKPKFVKKVVSSQKLRVIDMTSFRGDIEGSVLLQHQDDIHVAVNNYDEVLQSLLDKYALVKERVITVRHVCALVYS